MFEYMVAKCEQILTIRQMFTRHVTQDIVKSYVPCASKGRQLPSGDRKFMMSYSLSTLFRLIMFAVVTIAASTVPSDTRLAAISKEWTAPSHELSKLKLGPTQQYHSFIVNLIFTTH